MFILEAAALFVTRDDAEIRITGLSWPDRYWRYFELSLHLPWFLACVREPESGLLRCLFLADSLELVLLLEQQSPGLVVDEVLAGTPGYVNGSNGWQVERLEKLSYARSSKEAGIELVFDIEGGRTYRMDGPDRSSHIFDQVLYLSKSKEFVDDARRKSS